MTDQNHSGPFARPSWKAAGLTLAAAAAVLPSAPAAAQDAGMDPVPVITTSRESLQKEAAKESVADGLGAMPTARPSSRDVTVYGPPAPKVEKGKLAQVSWIKAPDEVPPALEQAINIVTRNYPSAKSARAALSAAASDVRAAKWLRFPRVGANIYQYSTNGNVQNRDTFDPQLTVSVPVWSGGRIGAEIRRAKASENASSAGYVETIQTLALTTSQTYFEIARLVQREQLLADSLKEHQRLVGTMERRVKQEVSPLADLELARSRAAQIEQEFTVTRSQRLTALRVLAELIADPSYDLGPVPFYKAGEIENPEALENEAAAYDPRLRRLTAQVDVASAAVDERKSSILPQFDAQYSYDNIFGSRLGVAVRAQTAGGLSQFSEVDSARLRVQAALEDVRVTDQQLRRTVATDIIEYESSKRRASISTNASETASRVSESYMRQFIAGRRSWLDVMNALREAVNAQIGKTDAEVTAMAAEVRLLLRSGRWHPEFQDQDSAKQ